MFRPICFICGGSGHAPSDCPRNLAAKVLKNPIAAHIEKMGWINEFLGIDPPSRPAPVPLEAKIKRWAGRRYMMRDILLHACRQPDRKATVADIGKHVYGRTMAGSNGEANRRTVRRMLRRIEKSVRESGDGTFAATVYGDTICISSGTRR
jgi:hypothetical protein